MITNEIQYQFLGNIVSLSYFHAQSLLTGQNKLVYRQAAANTLVT